MKRFYKNIFVIVAAGLLCSVVVAALPQVQPVHAAANDGSSDDFGPDGSIMPDVTENPAVPEPPVAQPGIPQPLAVPTSVENPVQPGVAYNLKQFWHDVAKALASYGLRVLVNNYVGNFVNKTLGQYKITSYLNYGINLADQVYVMDHMTGASSIRRYVSVKIIQDINSNPFQNVKLDPIFYDMALQTYNFPDLSKQKNALDVYAHIAKGGDLMALPAGQMATSFDYASKIKADASNAAALAMLTGRGNKDSQICTPANVHVLSQAGQIRLSTSPTPTAALPGDYEDIAYAKCVVNNPGQYVSQQIDSRLLSLLNVNLKPNDQVGQYVYSATQLLLQRVLGDELRKAGIPANNTFPDVTKLGL